MPRIIKGDRVVDDPWTRVTEADTRPEDLHHGDVIVPLELWQAERDALLARDGGLGVWLDSHQEPEAIAGDLTHFGLVAVNFPVFHDGRALSSAVLLRERFGWSGELRAVGDVQRDQLSYMRRCGFDAFEVRPDRDPEEELKGLYVMTDYYQGSVVEPRPVFRRVER